ncbi:endosome-associated-trafficking regulator 1 [Bombina bombina]|uniref:endosome-associated-trafficking regulator 1 n=1 Tax=Bombina bombina TaxID=8345 RepID=UPI00235AAE0A|nr:endosome-associated-trafficking regulator 1 [Bombina bombina]
MSGFSKQLHKSKTQIVTDDCQDEDDANPFSFKEFVKSKNLSDLPLKHCDGTFSKDTKHSSMLLPGSSSRSVHKESYNSLNLEYKDTFFKDPTMCEDLLDEDEDDDDEEEEESWCASYQPSVIESNHDASSGSSPNGTFNDYFGYSANKVSVAEQYPPWDFPSSKIYVPTSAPGSQAESHLDTIKDSPADLQFHNLKLTHQELQEENAYLKRKMVKLKELNQHQFEKIKILEMNLEEKILKEEKEARDLESMVQQVENNLQMMTKRATKAENNVTKLKQEVALLQIQLNTYKSENEALRKGETAGMNAVKQNASLALENLHKVVSGAQSSIKQLLSGAETLNLVGELLRSIDKIAEIHEEGVP